MLSKQHLYFRILIYYLAFFVALAICSEFTKEVADTARGKYATLAILVLWQLLALYSVEIFRVFGVKKRYVIIFRSLIVVGVISSFTIINPFWDPLPEFWKPPIFSVFHVATICMSVLMCYHILKDIFSSSATHMDHIWGAVVTYFFGIMIFADLYEICCLLVPGLLGEIYVMGMPNFINCILYSLNAASGLDALYPQAHGIFKNLANVEHIISNLFLIVILGRLLSLPLEKYQPDRNS